MTLPPDGGGYRLLVRVSVAMAMQHRVVLPTMRLRVPGRGCGGMKVATGAIDTTWTVLLIQFSGE